MFLAKKIISQFLLPVPLSLGIVAAGLILVWFSPKQRLGKTLITLGTLTMLFLGYSQVSRELLIPLERKYEPYGMASRADAVNSEPAVKWIVVLGGGHSDDNRIPLFSRISDPSLARLVEAVRLYVQHPGSRLILSGGAAYGSTSDAQVMADVAFSINVPREDVFLEDQSRDTEEEAVYIKPLVGNERFLLVTSASHMPRSVVLFERHGMHPIPAPAYFRTKNAPYLSPGRFFPSADGLEMATMAAHEYLGLLWLKLRGQP